MSADEWSWIVIRRDRGGRRDMLRSYKVFVDGEHAASVRRDRTCEIAVDVGPHVVEMRIDWCSSLPVEVVVEAGVPTEFRCRSGVVPGTGRSAITADPRTYITLELVPAADGA